MDQSMFSWEEPRARVSAWQDCEGAWLIRVATWPSNFAGLLMDFGRVGSSGKMCPASCQAMEDGTLAPSSGRWGNSGMGGPTESWTLNTSVWPSDASVCSLSDVLEETGSVPHKYYLSAKACAGILRRAEKRGKELPTMLRLALEQAVSEPAESETREGKTR